MSDISYHIYGRNRQKGVYAVPLPIKAAKPEPTTQITTKKVVGNVSIYHYNGIAERIL